jgi:hemerythrin-like domain-containing protein
MTTAIETLGQQHRKVLGRLKAVEAAALERAAELEDVYAFLQGEVREHFALEEEALFPILATHPQLAAGLIAVMEGEHEEFRALLAELGAALRTAGAERRAVVISRLIALLRAHIDKQDHVLFPLATQVLTPQELATVEARVASRSARPAHAPAIPSQG